jgi:NAD(P)H-flavin reductase
MALDPGPDVSDVSDASASDLMAEGAAVGAATPAGPTSSFVTPATAAPTRGAVVTLGQLLEPIGTRVSRRGPAGPIGSLRTPTAPVTPLDAPLDAPSADPSGVAPDGAPSAGDLQLAPAAPVASARGGTAPPTAAAPAADVAPISGPAGQILEIVDVGPSVRIFKVGRPAGLTFTGGQYLKAGIDAVRTASFSLASAPYETHLELCIELIPGGRLTPQMFALRPGGTLALGGQVKGSFVLDTTGHTHLMIATVTGIAPLRSMLRQALHDGTNDRFVVLHGASYVDELPYHDELVALAATDPRVEYVPTVSRPGEARNAGWSGQTGRVDPLASNVAVTLDRGDLRAYACGNPGMVSTVTSDLRALGIRVSSETFD